MRVARRRTPIGFAITNPVRPTATNPAVSKRFVMARTPVLNERLEFKHLFEKKARRAQGKYVTFSVLRF